MVDIIEGYKKHHITYKKYDELMVELVKKCKRIMKKCNAIPTCVYGPARGGLPIAVHLSHHLDIPLSLKPKDGMLLVDDINDSGKTINKIKDKYLVCFTAVLFDSRASAASTTVQVLDAEPNVWYVFPWEKKIKE